MYGYLENNLSLDKEPVNNSTFEVLGMEWAKKYLQNLNIDFQDSESIDTKNLNQVLSQNGRKKTAQKLRKSLQNVSLRAWNKTETLLFKEIKRHRIKSELIDPWEIARDSFQIYEKTLDVYTEQMPLHQLSMVEEAYQQKSLGSKTLSIYSQQLAPNQLTKAISPAVGALRKKYTQQDPRIIGVVSMQFHYTSQMLLELLSNQEQSLIGGYFKVIDDHLYMPLQRAYNAAAKLDSDSVALIAVQNLLPSSTHIAKSITKRMIELYPTYCSYSGQLNNKKVLISSIRDVEMFQVYLWVSALEGNITAIVQELFPLCVMLYPTLKVSWEIIRQMLHLLGQEISEHLNTEQANILMPYFQVLWHMFSPEVLDENDFDNELNAYDEIKTNKSLFA